MALTAAQLKKYSLSESDATSSDHDKGIVEVQGKYYSIDGFKREQRDDIDTDQGKVFSSSLEKDSNKDFTNFNTATDVEGALNSLFDKEEEEPVADPGPELPVVQSPKLAEARARVAQREEDRVSGQMAEDLYGPADGSTPNAFSFMERYRSRLGEKLESGYYVKNDVPTNKHSKNENHNHTY